MLLHEPLKEISYHICEKEFALFTKEGGICELFVVARKSGRKTKLSFCFVDQIKKS